MVAFFGQTVEDIVQGFDRCTGVALEKSFGGCYQSVLQVDLVQIARISQTSGHDLDLQASVRGGVEISFAHRT